MTNDGRHVTAKLPAAIFDELEEIARRSDRSKSWIIRQAVGEWLAEEQRRHELTLKALRDVDEGRTLSHEEVKRHFAERRKERAAHSK